MQIRILAVGERMPAWVDEACAEYLKRFPRDFPVSLHGLAAAGRARVRDATTAVRREGEALLARVEDGHRVIALDVLGKHWSTQQLAQQVEAWRMDGRNVDLLVGGPDGLDAACLARAEMRWSLSSLTLPHPLVRIVLLEQIYRVWSIIHRHPYHR